MSFRLFIILFAVGAGLWACSSVKEIYVQTDRVPVTAITPKDDSLEAFIKPYKNELSFEMDKVIGYASDDLVRARPEGALGNFVTDATLSYLERNSIIPEDKYICIMNHGGLRAPISKGNITVGDIYKLMPFDNTVVIAKLPMHAMDSICNYLVQKGGEPISGFKMEKAKCSLNNSVDLDTLYVVTSDYLFNGGDHMDFFEKNYSNVNTGIFLRDMLLDEVKFLDTLTPKLEGRIQR
tara:strand:- start:10844 stop:11554 length:711 start_codon:yes stop_codon:yes gene_type:complete